MLSDLDNDLQIVSRGINDGQVILLVAYKQASGDRFGDVLEKSSPSIEFALTSCAQSLSRASGIFSHDGTASGMRR